MSFTEDLAMPEAIAFSFISFRLNFVHSPMTVSTRNFSSWM